MARRITPRRTLLPPNRSSAWRAEGVEQELSELRARLAEAEETLRAIQSGDVDAVIVSGDKGERVYTLRGAEYAYRALVEAMNEGAATISADGAILYCNTQIALLLELPPEKIIGKRLDSVVAPADKDLLSALFTRALAGEAGKSEVRFCARGGNLVPAYVALSPLQINEAPAVCMVVTDLREHKQLDELITAGNLARSILEHSAEAIAVCDEQGRIIQANGALRTLCGRNPLFEPFDDVLPMQIVDQNSAAEANSRRFSVSVALGGETLRALEVIYRRPGERRGDGRLTWLLLTAGPLRSGDHVVGCVLTLVDITRNKAAERALLRSEKLAATGQLAATIAHEINNPLTAVGNFLYLIQQRPAGEQVHQYVTDAITELDRVSHIAKQALAFYRDTKLPEKVHLSQVLDDILLLFRKDFDERRSTFDKTYAVPGEILGYPGEMRQVFSNLLRNAIEALPQGGRVRVLIRPSRFAGGKGVGVFISDNGSGIAPEIRHRIFEPFFTTKEKKGTGLGLWVAKDLVEKHGGVIRVRSSTLRGRVGTCFGVFLPAAPPDENATPAPC